MTAIAIDFGTSRTKLAYLKDGEAELMRFERDLPYVPSLFYLPAGSDEILWGFDAEAMLDEDPAGVVDTPKRKLLQTHVWANGRKEAPVRLLARMFADLRAQAGAHVAALNGKAPEKVQLTIPVLYGPTDERRMREAAVAAGFSEVDVVAEPVAAARAWLAETKADAGDVIVFDAGGGTIDWAWLRREGGEFRAVPECPPGGDTRVGGHDLDLEILELVRHQLLAQGDGEAAAAIEARPARFVATARALKESLARGAPAPVRIKGRTVRIEPAQVGEVLNARFISQACEHLSGYLAKVCVQRPGAKPTILLVGGSGRLKGLKEAIESATRCPTAWWERSEFATALGGIGRPKLRRTLSLPTDRNVRWRYYSPKFIQQLRQWDGIVAVDIPDINAFDLLERGLAEFGGFYPGNGKILIIPDKRAFLMAGLSDELINYVARTPDEYAPYLTKPLTTIGSQADRVFDKLYDREGSLEIVYQCMVCHNEEVVRRRLLERTRTILKQGRVVSDAGDLHDIARTWTVLFGDKEQFKRCIDICENTAKFWGGINAGVSVCELHILNNDFCEAQRVMDEMINFMQNKGQVKAEEFIAIAGAHIQFFGDVNRAYDYLQKAKTLPEQTTYSLRSLMENYLLIKDIDSCAEVLSTMEKIESETTNLCRVSEYWAIIGFNEMVVRLLSKAEQLVEVAYDKLRCAEGWYFLMRDEARARKLLEEAEADATSSFNRILCAEAWCKLFSDKPRAEVLVRRAEVSASDERDWKRCRTVWRRLGREADAARCEAKRLELRR